MKIGWAGLGAAVILIVAGVFSYRALAQQHQTTQLASLSQQYMVNAAELPAAGAWQSIRAITVPGSQARSFAQALSAAQQKTQALVHVTLSGVRVQLKSAAIISRNPLTLQAQVVIQRRFRPKGANQLDAGGTFQFANGPIPRLVEVNLTTNRSSSSTGPDGFNLNLWNMVPAGPLPHGS
jgi:hypothetical protein